MTSFFVCLYLSSVRQTQHSPNLARQFLHSHNFCTTAAFNKRTSYLQPITPFFPKRGRHESLSGI